MHRFISAAFLMVVSLISMAQEETTFCHVYDGDEMGDWGPARALNQTIDVAIGMHGVSYTGVEIRRLRIPFSSTSGVSNVKLWLSKELNIDGPSSVIEPDIVSVEATDQGDGWWEATLTEPYVLDADGVYAGCTFDVESSLPYPLRVGMTGREDGFWVHSVRSYRKWLDISSDENVTLAMEVIISGLKFNNVIPTDGQRIYGMKGDAPVVTFGVSNNGTNEIESVDVDYSVAGINGSEHVALSTPIEGVIGSPGEVALQLPAIDKSGRYEVTVTIAKVNGADNVAAEVAAVVPLSLLGHLSHHRPLVEEYSGMWCIGCARGIVGMERMNAAYPDDFVGIVYHGQDALQTIEISDYPSVINYFPWATINRQEDIDPYFGYLNEETTAFGLDIVWLDYKAKLAELDVDVDAKVSEYGTCVEVEASMTPTLDMNDADFEVEFVLTADGLHRKDWVQFNSLDSSISDGKEDWERWFDSTTGEGVDVPDCHFNDVALISSRVNGNNAQVTGSLIENQSIMSSYTFTLSDAKCNYIRVENFGQAVIQDLSKLNVIVVLTDKATGRVINSIKKRVVYSGENSVSDISVKNDEQPLMIYDLSGRAVRSCNAPGIYIVRQADGSVVKVMR